MGPYGGIDGERAQLIEGMADVRLQWPSIPERSEILRGGPGGDSHPRWIKRMPRAVFQGR